MKPQKAAKRDTLKGLKYAKMYRKQYSRMGG
jgi:hypothetical protein